MDLFEKIRNRVDPLGQYSKDAHGYYSFPKLEGPISNKMTFNGKEVLTWSINNYLGLANHPEVRKVDAEASAEWGLGYPMGSRMMSGQTKYHEELEAKLADFMEREDAYLLNFGYQGFMSIIDSLVDRKDVVVYDSECHACILDGVRLHMGKRFVYAHNDIDKCRKQLEHATRLAEKTGGAILLITEGVFGMSGDQGNIKEIIDLREKEGFNFRILVDDAHGFGTLGATGKGAAEEQGVHNKVDIFMCTFAKSMASIGAFVTADADIVNYLRYSMRSQIFAKSLPMPLVIGALKRLEMVKDTSHKDKLWQIVNALQDGLKEAGFNLGATNSPVTPVILKGTIGTATRITHDLRENYKIFCSVVIYPVVPRGIIILRLIPTATHTLEDVKYTLDVFKKIKDKLSVGEYDHEGAGILKANL